MVREDIFAGLKQAISKGSSLKQAMMSFYKAGYKKEEIEEAARFVQSEQVQQRMNIDYPIQENKPMQNLSKKYLQSEIAQIQKPVQKISQYGSKTETEPQKINYTKEKKSKLGWIILISGTLIIIILVILAILFKEQVSGFINNLAG
ncbi:MAG: hypothetical protein AAB866_00025 [Patescibacteria group bacterium]